MPKLNSINGYPHNPSNTELFHAYFRFVGKLALPTILYLFVVFIITGQNHIFSLLLVSNFISPDYANGMSYWFLEVLLQIYLLFSIIFFIKPIRLSISDSLYRFFFLASIIAYIISRTCTYFFDTNELFNRLPHLLFYLFLLGALTAFSKTTSQKIKTSILLTAICAEAMITRFGGLITFYYFAVIATIWCKNIYLPKSLCTPIKLVAMSSLFIYLSHFQSLSLLKKINADIAPEISVLFALVVGIVLSTVWKKRFVLISRTKTRISSSMQSKTVV